MADMNPKTGLYYTWRSLKLICNKYIQMMSLVFKTLGEYKEQIVQSLKHVFKIEMIHYEKSIKINLIDFGTV